jgi:hypothetical protein
LFLHPSSATALLINGDAEVHENSSDTWRSLTNHHSFSENTYVPNTTTGIVRLVFAPNFSTNILFPNTGIVVLRSPRDKPSPTSATEFQLKLLYGTIAGATPLLSGASKYEFQSIDGVAGVRVAPCEYLFNTNQLTLVSGTIVFIKIKNGLPTPATLGPGQSIILPAMKTFRTTVERDTWISDLLHEKSNSPIDIP